MTVDSAYFPNVKKTDLSDHAAAILRCTRAVLATSPPSNVRPDATFVRGEKYGDDFVLPHSGFDGFGLAIRVGTLSGRVLIAYSGCRRPDRGDEFDAAFNPSRKDMIATIKPGTAFCDDLAKALLEYLRRKLCVVQEVRQGDGAVVNTRILWPSATGNVEKGAPTLWSRRKGVGLLRATEEKKRSIAFDEGAS